MTIQNEQTAILKIYVSEGLTDHNDFDDIQTSPVVEPHSQDTCRSYLIVRATWIFHKNDVDPWPSHLHAHHSERPIKLDAITGNVFHIHTRQRIGRIRPKDLMRVHTELLASKDFSEKARQVLNTSA